MKYIEFAHPEGGRFLVHVDHITSAHYRPGDGGETRSRLGLDLDQRQNEIVLFDEEADRTWDKLKRLMGET
jgi:hypothetical protein